MSWRPKLVKQDHQEGKEVVAPADAAVEAHIEFDRRLKGLVSEVWRSGYQIACAQGCFSCCYEPAHILRQEAELLIQLVNDMSEEDRQHVLAATREWVKRYLGGGFEKIENPPAVPYRLAKLACPFLKNGQCMVYEDRPIPCRGHLAVKEAHLCHDDNLRETQEYVVTSHLMGHAYTKLGKVDGIQADHLGVWMAEYLLGEKIPSKGRAVVGKDGRVRET